MKKKEIIFTILLLFLDQGSKYGMEHLLQNQSISIIPNFFSLNYVQNTGGAWSILSGNTIVLIIISLVCLFALAYMKPTVKDSKLKSISFTLLYAGIIGNLLDRIVFGHVKDFLSFTIFGYSFPVFNIADILIVTGACLLVITIWKGENHAKNSVRVNRKYKTR